MIDLPTPIVSPEALRALLDASPDAAAANGLRLLDARGGPDAEARYARGHLEGAVRVDLDRDLAGEASRPEQGGRHPLPDLDVWARTLGGWGIEPTTRVVIYDDAGGALAAARAWWMLRAVGHEAVAVLDGGLEAARAAGLEVTTEPPAAPPGAPPYPASAWSLPHVGVEEVELLVHDPEWTLLDVRAPERYRGETEPLDPVAGHIPGASNLPLTENLGADGRFKSAGELRALYASALGDSTRAIVSCGSGVTACHTLLALSHAGLTGAKLYVGSFSEWSRSGRRVATGSERGA